MVFSLSLGGWVENQTPTFVCGLRSYGTFQIFIHHLGKTGFNLGNEEDEISLSDNFLSNKSNLFQLKKFFFEIWMKM